MSIATKREAIVAAKFVRRSKLTNPKAIERLGRFAANLNLFDHGEDNTDDWDDYTARVQAERKQDDICDITERSVGGGLTPQEVFKADQSDYLTKMIEEVQPSFMVPATTPPAFTNPGSIDYRDPNDFYRTNLIKAAIDNDTHRVKKLVTDDHANLYVTDVEGNNALQNAINFGNDEMAFLLRRLMSERPQTARASKSA